MNRYDDLLQDTIDLHCHVDLEFSETLFRKRGPEDEWLPAAERSGMRGVVLKSHLWPTVSVVPFIRRLYEGPVEVWPSITLNGATGGIDLWSVEAAYHQGARTVFLPTWGSVNDLRNGGFHRRLADAFEWFRPERLCVQRVIDDDGKPTDDVRDLVRFCRDHGLTLATGHVSWQESLAVAEEAAAVGLERLVCSHPLSNSVRAPSTPYGASPSSARTPRCAGPTSRRAGRTPPRWWPPSGRSAWTVSSSPPTTSPARSRSRPTSSG